MKIVYISSSTFPSKAANSIHVMKMCQAFSRNGHEVTLVAKQGGQADWQQIKQEYGVEADFACQRIPLKNMRGRGYIYAWQAVNKALSLQPDIIYCRNLASAWLATMRGYKVIFESHAPVSDSGLVANSLFRRLLKSANLMKVVVITKALANYYRMQYGVADNLLLVAADGADEIAEDTIPMPLNGRAGCMQIGYVGHLYAGKGMEVILPLARLCSNADFHIVGGTDKDRDYWREQATDIPNITFHGHVPHHQTAAYIKAFDVALLPNQAKVNTYGKGGNDIGQWTSPLKAFEYMAAGKPIIASDLTVLKEVLKNDETAVLTEYDNPSDWSAALHRLINEPDFRVQLGQNAQQQFLAEYTWQKRAEKLVRFK
jgi:glycosyltransferase involved in cell wall biosynthesis